MVRPPEKNSDPEFISGNGEEAPVSTPRAGGGGSGRWILGTVIGLVLGIPVTVLLVLYARELLVTYTMTADPLTPAAIRMSRTVEGVVVGALADLEGTADAIDWSGPVPSEEKIRATVGAALERGHLGTFSGWAVTDRSGTVLARLDRRDIDPYLSSAQALAKELLARGGRARTRVVAVSGKSPLVLLLVAVRTGAPAASGGGVLVGLENFSSQMARTMPVPRASASPGRSYLLSSDGTVLASSDRTLTGRSLETEGRGAVLERFRSGKAGGFVRTVGGTETLFGSAPLTDLVGVTSGTWFAVLEAPNADIRARAGRVRLDMDLIVFLLVPSFMGLAGYLLIRSFRR